MAQDIVEELRDRVADGRETVRGVARKIVGTNATNGQIESKRRHLTKILDGTEPQPPTVRQIAVALGLDPADYVTKADPKPSTADQLATIVSRIDGLEASVRGIAERRASAAPADDAALRSLLAELQAQVVALEDVNRESVARIAKLEKGAGARAGAKSSSAPRPASPRRKAAGQ